MIRGYYFITGGSLSLKGNLSDVRAAVRAGVSVIQYRNKDSDSYVMYKECLSIRKIVKNAFLLINDRIDIAFAVNADGVHIGNQDLPYESARRLLGRKKIIGMTVHNLKEAHKAQRFGADYLGVSPIFSTATKSDAGLPCGPGLIKEIKRKINLPVVAIGGITLENADSVITAGADAVCAISSVVTKENVTGEIRKFQNKFRYDEN